MSNWRAILGFDERDAPDFATVHARYRQLLLNLPYPMDFDTARALNDAVRTAELELLAADDD